MKAIEVLEGLRDRRLAWFGGEFNDDVIKKTIRVASQVKTAGDYDKFMDCGTVQYINLTRMNCRSKIEIKEPVIASGTDVAAVVLILKCMEGLDELIKLNENGYISMWLEARVKYTDIAENTIDILNDYIEGKNIDYGIKTIDMCDEVRSLIQLKSIMSFAIIDPGVVMANEIVAGQDVPKEEVKNFLRKQDPANIIKAMMTLREIVNDGIVDDVDFQIVGDICTAEAFGPKTMYTTTYLQSGIEQGCKLQALYLIGQCKQYRELISQYEDSIRTWCKKYQ